MQKLLAADGASDDYLAYSVAVSHDTVVIGAYGDDDNGSKSGSAYVYVWDGASWTQQAKLQASDAAVGHEFAKSVAIFGDSIVVGAHRDDDNGASSGSAYVFVKPVGGWSGTLNEDAKLLASDGAESDYFGRSVAVSGDSVVAGAYGDDDSGGASGSAYVFDKPVGGWSGTLTEDAKLLASDGAAVDYFGWHVAVSGSYVVVGAYYDDDNGSASGSAYVFVEPGGGWSGTLNEDDKLLPSDGAGSDYFGWSVAVSGDSVVVGAYYDDDSGSGSGSAYVFVEPGGGWSGTLNEDAKLLASDGVQMDNFGRSVAMSGDTVVVGAFLDDDNGSGSGSAYVFVEPGGGWSGTLNEDTKLLPTDGAADDYFGFSVAVSFKTIVGGAEFDDDNGENSGSAYVFGNTTLLTADFEDGPPGWLVGQRPLACHGRLPA